MTKYVENVTSSFIIVNEGLHIILCIQYKIFCCLTVDNTQEIRKVIYSTGPIPLVQDNA